MAMGIADITSRLASAISSAGQMFIIINLPLHLLRIVGPPWFPLLFMLFAPMLMPLLQLALTRSREYGTDRTAAHLAGDPRRRLSDIWYCQGAAAVIETGGTLHPEA